MTDPKTFATIDAYSQVRDSLEPAQRQAVDEYVDALMALSDNALQLVDDQTTKLKSQESNIRTFTEAFDLIDDLLKRNGMEEGTLVERITALIKYKQMVCN